MEGLYTVPPLIIPTNNLNGGRPIARLIGADMTLTTDQAFTFLVNVTEFVPTKIVGIRRSGAFGVTCAGGVYTAATKGGNAVVAAAQSWANLTGAGKIVDATIAAVVGTDVVANALYLSLTTGNTGALTADIYVFGNIIS